MNSQHTVTRGHSPAQLLKLQETHFRRYSHQQAFLSLSHTVPPQSPSKLTKISQLKRSSRMLIKMIICHQTKIHHSRSHLKKHPSHKTVHETQTALILKNIVRIVKMNSQMTLMLYFPPLYIFTLFLTSAPPPGYIMVTACPAWR